MTTKVRTYRARYGRMDTLKYSGGIPNQGPDQPPTETHTFNASDIVANNSFIGGDQPGWKKIISQGGTVLNSATGIRVTGGGSPFHGSCKRWADPSGFKKRGYNTAETVGVFAPSVPTFSSGSGIAANIAATIFTSRCIQATTAFQGGVFLGELREAVHMVRHPAQGLKDLFRSYLRKARIAKRGLIKAPVAKRTKALAGLYLEESFGWAPLVSDIRSGAEALARLSNTRKTVTHVKGYGAYESDPREPLTGILSNDLLRIGYSSKMTDIERVAYYGGVGVEGSGAQFALDTLGVNFSQFAPTIWELLPWSFLVDYFSNIGQVIEAGSYASSRLVYCGFSAKYSRFERIQSTGDLTNKADSNYIESSVSRGETVQSCDKFSRTPSTFPIPHLHFKVPGTGTKIANMAALLAQHAELIPF